MRNTLFALILYGCASTRPAPARVPTFAGAFEDPPPPVMVWRALVRDALPAPIRAVAARSVDEAVVAAGGALFAVRGEGVVAPLCAREFFPGDEVSAVAVAGALLLAAGGDDDAPTLWRSDDGGTRCVRALLPSIGPAGRGAAPVRLTLVGEVAWLWSARGVLRSQDGGRRWMALPALSNVRRVFAGVGEETLAAVSDGPDEGERSVASHRGRLLRLDELDERAPRWRIVAEDRLLPMLGARRGDEVVVQRALDAPPQHPHGPLGVEPLLRKEHLQHCGLLHGQAADADAPREAVQRVELHPSVLNNCPGRTGGGRVDAVKGDAQRSAGERASAARRAYAGVWRVRRARLMRT